MGVGYQVPGAGEEQMTAGAGFTDTHPLPQLVLTGAEAARGWGTV
jgi:hypothetical protein